MPTRAQTTDHPATEARKPWQTPSIIVSEASDSEKNGITIDTTFAGPS